MQTFLSVGFSPSAALVTWQLELSGAFKTFTYWPTHTISFNTELFGSHSFQPNQLDLSAIKDPNPFDFVLLCIPSLKDVNRMVKKIERFVSKNSVVLVNIPEGQGMLQRLVKAQVPKIPVAGFICDFPVRHIPDSQTNIWQVIQWGNSKSPGPQMACHIEPIAIKLVAPLETALSSQRIPCSHPKNSAAFLAVQWERTIFTVGFELLSILFNTPSVEKLTKEPIARPIIDGVVNELLMLANAAGAKSLPSCSHFVQQAPFLTRKAPSIFAIPHASRMYYEFYDRAPIPLDLLLLSQIMLADDLKKARTPYLDSTYAYATQLQSINVTPSDLFCRVDLEAKQRQLDRDYEQKHGNSNVAKLEQQLQRALLQAEERESKSREIEATLKSRELKLTEAQAAVDNRQKDYAAMEQRSMQIKAREEQLAQREEALAERARRLESREHDLSSERLNRNGGGHTPTGTPHPLGRTQSASKLPMMQQAAPPSMPQTPKQIPKTPKQAPFTPSVNGGWDGQQSPPQTMQFMTPQHRPRPSRQINPNMLDNHAQLTGRPISQQAPMPRRASQASILPDQLDMMSLTQSKNRRQSLRNGGPHRSASMTSISNSTSGSYSQTFQLDGIMGLASQDRYSFAGPKKVPAAISSDYTLGANRPFAHGFSGGAGGPPHHLHDTKSQNQLRVNGSRSDAPDFSSFGYNFDNKHSNSGSQGSGSLSGNSRSTPPRSPSVTPPTPNTLDPADMKEPYRIPGM